MGSKTWIADDIAQGVLKITPRANGVLHVERRYWFVDEMGEVLERIRDGRVVEDLLLIELPTTIVNALMVIDDWTKQKALIQEGMA